MSKKHPRPRLPLTLRQYIVLRVFVNRRGKWYDRPTLTEIAKAIGAKSRAGVYCGHILRLLAKGYLDRDLPHKAARGYFITPRGRRALRDWKADYAQDAKQSISQNRNRKSG